MSLWASQSCYSLPFSEMSRYTEVGNQADQQEVSNLKGTIFTRSHPSCWPGQEQGNSGERMGEDTLPLAEIAEVFMGASFGPGSVANDDGTGQVSTLPSAKETFILGLIKSNLLAFADVISSSYGHTSPYYIDLRAIYSYPDLLLYAVGWLKQVTQDADYDFICGIETASLPMVGAYGLATMEPTLYLRTKQKPYGNRKIVEGHFQPNDKIILVDDLIVEPEITLEFIHLAESAGLTVVGLYVLYEKLAHELSKDVFEKAGYPVKSLFTFEDVANLIRAHHESLGYKLELADLIRSFGNFTHPSS
jgi:orotate phosphoribosyltransferase